MEANVNASQQFISTGSQFQMWVNFVQGEELEMEVNKKLPYFY